MGQFVVDLQRFAPSAPHNDVFLPCIVNHPFRFDWAVGGVQEPD